MVLALRDSTPNSSWGADKIEALWANMDLGLKSPSRSSITRILKDYRQTQRRRRHLAGPLPGRCPPPAEHANDVWAFDGKGTWRGTDPLTAEDVHSRFLLDIANVPLTTLHVQRRCATLFANHGLPRRIRTDGGLPFAGCGVGRLSSLSLWWLKQGIDLEVVSKPQHNGHLERFHSTLEQEGARDINVDVALEQFRDIYNNIRPHAALGGRTPVELYLPVPFARAVRPPVVVDDVRKVTSHGAFGWCGHRIFISEVLTSETITFQFLEPSLWLIRYRHLPLALLDEKHMVLRRAFGF